MNSRLDTGDCHQSPPTSSTANSSARSAGEPGGRGLVRLGACFGDIAGKKFLNDEIPFDGTPEGFDSAVESLRVAFHETAMSPMRPCGHPGPWSRCVLDERMPSGMAFGGLDAEGKPVVVVNV